MGRKKLEQSEKILGQKMLQIIEIDEKILSWEIGGKGANRKMDTEN